MEVKTVGSMKSKWEREGLVICIDDLNNVCLSVVLWVLGFELGGACVRIGKHMLHIFLCVCVSMYALVVPQ